MDAPANSKPANTLVDNSTNDNSDLHTDEVGNFLRLLSADPNFQVTWTNRRKIINYSLLFGAGVIGTITLTVCGLAIFGQDVHPNAVMIMSSLIYSVVLAATGIIGSYVFGASYESNNFRGHLSGLASTLIRK